MTGLSNTFDISFGEKYGFLQRHKKYYRRTTIMFYCPFSCVSSNNITWHHIPILWSYMYAKTRLFCFLWHHLLIATYSLDTMQGIISIDNNQSTYIRKQALAGHNYEPFIQYFFNLLLLNIIFIQKTCNATRNFQGR